MYDHSFYTLFHELHQASWLEADVSPPNCLMIRTHSGNFERDGSPTELWSANDFVLQRLVDAMEQRLREIMEANYDKTRFVLFFVG